MYTATTLRRCNTPATHLDIAMPRDTATTLQSTATHSETAIHSFQAHV